MSLSDPDLRFVADAVRAGTGMQYDAAKAYLVEARLGPLQRAAGLDSLGAYVARLRRDPVELARAVDALTINETSWFRDQSPFTAFTEVMLPALRTARADTRRLRIWSAACSSGQEAYSLAMLCREELPGWDVQILASDVSSEMVARVRAGRYRQVEMNRGLPANRLVGSFRRVGAEWEVAPELRAMVTARQLNLVSTLPPIGRFDVVFLRNVLIYFDAPTKAAVLDRVRPHLADDGYLVLGSAEAPLETGTAWRREAHGRAVLHRPVPGRATALRSAALPRPLVQEAGPCTP